MFTTVNAKEELKMATVLAIVDIIALIAVPIIAVWVGQVLQNRAAKRKDKIAIFQCLMTHRARAPVGHVGYDMLP